MINILTCFIQSQIQFCPLVNDLGFIYLLIKRIINCPSASSLPRLDLTLNLIILSMFCTSQRRTLCWRRRLTMWLRTRSRGTVWRTSDYWSWRTRSTRSVPTSSSWRGRSYITNTVYTMCLSLSLSLFSVSLSLLLNLLL